MGNVHDGGGDVDNVHDGDGMEEVVWVTFMMEGG